MTFSIQTKLFASCILLVLLTTISSSVTYYVLIKQDTHRESQQRIEIAFDIILDDLAEYRQSYLKNFDEFLQRDRSMALALMVYSRRRSEQMSLQNTLVGYLNNLGYISSSDRLMLYGPDKELIVTYFPKEDQDSEKTVWTEQEAQIFLSGEIPDSTTPALFSEGSRIGIRLSAPLKNNNDIVGILPRNKILIWYSELLKISAAWQNKSIVPALSKNGQQ